MEPGAAMPPQADEATLRRFLLGQLEDRACEELEARLFEDDACFERLLTSEEALIDDYYLDRLAGDERARFEQRYLTSPDGRQRMAIARAVTAGRRGAPATPQAPGRASALAGWLRAGTPRWQAGMAAALLLACTGGMVWVWGSNRALRQQLLDARTEVSRQQRLEADLRRQVGAAPTPIDQPPPVLAPPPPGTPVSPAGPLVATTPTGPIVALALRPGLVRDSQDAAHVQLPRNASLMVLELQLESNPPDATYRALIRSVDGADIWRQDVSAPRPFSRTLPLFVVVPARALGPAEYLLTLQRASGGRPPEDHATYYFRIDGPP